MIERLWWFNRGQVAWPERLAAGNLIIIPDVKEMDPAQFRSLRLKSPSAIAPESSRSLAPAPAGTGETKLDLPRSSTVKGRAFARDDLDGAAQRRVMLRPVQVRGPAA